VAFSANDGPDERETVQSSETRMTLRPQMRGRFGLGQMMVLPMISLAFSLLSVSWSNYLSIVPNT
jgi:hypothetical protein